MNGDEPREMTSRFYVSNLHCQGCVENITNLLRGRHDGLLAVMCSLESKTVSVVHPADFSPDIISEELTSCGYNTVVSSGLLALISSRLLQNLQARLYSHEKKGAENLGLCEACRQRASETTTTVSRSVKDGEQLTTFAPTGLTASSHSAPEKTQHSALRGVQPSSPSGERFRALLSITGMTCSACVRAITEALEAKPYVLKANVVLLASSATVDFEGPGRAEPLKELIEELGYGAVVEEISLCSSRQAGKAKLKAQLWKATFAIDGMTDSSSAVNITDALEHESWVKKAEVVPEGERVAIEFENKSNVLEISTIIKSIEGIQHVVLVDLARVGDSDAKTTPRNVSILIDGIADEQTVRHILAALTALDHPITVSKQPTIQEPTITVSYEPEAPYFTIRHILAAIESVDQTLRANIYHPPTLEERARAMHARERLHIIYRVVLSILAAIPSFLIGILFMGLVSSRNSVRLYLMQEWANVSRAQWALFIISTPVYFFASDVFHRRAVKELIALWRPGSSTPLVRRFYRFGSMNLLMSLGTSIAYFASIAELVITSRQPRTKHRITNHQSFYFDSVVFLTLFLLIGRLIEAWSRAKTADAVASLGQLRPANAIVCNSTQRDKTLPDASFAIQVDEIEPGDVVVVPHGASPPCDGILLDDHGSFDESSLTGEARLIDKRLGDEVFSGTTNKGPPVIIRATKILGTSMLDQIIQVVREGQARRAPVERIGDVITSYFVPVITAISVSTWMVWLVLGEAGILPRSWLDVQSGGWPYWSLQFSIAVFIIACPCGFGLAAPTAMFVGGGVAAKAGILAKGGGAAFQEASMLDIVVFDKTGTLTEGGNPSVSDWKGTTASSSPEIDSTLLFSLIRTTEEKSSHPIAAAIVKFLKGKGSNDIHSTSVEELPGRGMKGLYTSNKFSGKSYMVLIGNERLMSENHVLVDNGTKETLNAWKVQGKSVVLVAVRVTDIETSILGSLELRVIAAVTDVIRPESKGVIKSLQDQGMETWMISGDNETTAQAVGKMVGICPDRIIAGVLPEQKAEKIQYLQRCPAKSNDGWLLGPGASKNTTRRAIVAMVGDGVNDSPALAVADVGIAIGSGSDVAISSADFVLMSSDLSAVVVLVQLSRAVFRRIKFNFGWALVYNLIALPIAAGVLYPIPRSAGHIRLDPVWASLAMALSSISVVTSSLALKTTLPYVGFRKRSVHQ
ncbi:uncharacterized protein PV09_07070 [Verruconis gallopava]|uniref:HMA domain-containing protein n=1 Tax=Verruconis gallopava TaxID=253628 RepID=A0A0D2A484_9PEZI|nr:uncharacterized protein PV09_07070 [Verruconis gallopava]KIW01598.1 hypothetical protein PV09_07070 [Verruconis gallopava]